MITIKKIINYAIALIALIVCFQVVTLNKDKFFFSNEKSIKEYHNKINSMKDKSENILTNEVLSIK